MEPLLVPARVPPRARVQGTMTIIVPMGIRPVGSTSSSSPLVTTLKRAQSRSSPPGLAALLNKVTPLVRLARAAVARRLPISNGRRFTSLLSRKIFSSRPFLSS